MNWTEILYAASMLEVESIMDWYSKQRPRLAWTVAMLDLELGLGFERYRAHGGYPELFFRGTWCVPAGSGPSYFGQVLTVSS